MSHIIGLLIGLLVIAIPVILIIWIVRRLTGTGKGKAEAKAAGQLNLLPFKATIHHAYQLAWEHRVDFVKISWMWIVLAALLSFAYRDLTSHFLGKAPMSRIGDPKLMASMDMTPFVIDIAKRAIINLPLNLFMVFVVSAIAVPWHRLILRHEPVTNSYHFKIDNCVWDYCVLALLISVLQILPSFFSLGGLLFMSSPAIYGLINLAIVIIFLTLISYQVRLVAALPAKALGIENVTLKDVLYRTRFNVWRLFWAPLACFIPGLIPVFLFLLWFTTAHTSMTVFAGNTWLLYTLIGAVASVICVPVYLSFLSLAYRHFYEKTGE